MGCEMSLNKGERSAQPTTTKKKRTLSEKKNLRGHDTVSLLLKIIRFRGAVLLFYNRPHLIPRTFPFFFGVPPLEKGKVLETRGRRCQSSCAHKEGDLLLWKQVYVCVEFFHCLFVPSCFLFWREAACTRLAYLPTHCTTSKKIFSPWGLKETRKFLNISDIWKITNCVTDAGETWDCLLLLSTCKRWCFH